MRNLTLSLTMFFCMVMILNAQDTLVFINGKQKADVEFMKVQDDFLYYQVWKGEKNKIKLIAKEEVYAVYTKEGHHIITYKQDSLGFILDQGKMFDYIEGMADAWESFHNPYVPVIGFAVSAGAGIWPGIPWGLAVPVAYPAVISLFEIKEKNLPNFPEEKKGNYYYTLGYKDIARAKKLRSAVISGGSGYVLGMLLNIYLVNPIP
jgi:hypothetical protein